MSETKPEDGTAYEVGNTVAYEGQELYGGQIDAYSRRPVASPELDVPSAEALVMIDPDYARLLRHQEKEASRVVLGSELEDYVPGRRQARSIHFPTCQVCVSFLANPPSRWGKMVMRVKRWITRQRFLRFLRVRLSDGVCPHVTTPYRGPVRFRR